MDYGGIHAPDRDLLQTDHPVLAVEVNRHDMFLTFALQKPKEGIDDGGGGNWIDILIVGGRFRDGDLFEYRSNHTESVDLVFPVLTLVEELLDHDHPSFTYRLRKDFHAVTTQP